MESVLSFDPMDMEQPLRHHFLLSAVAPRPICFASTVDSAGNVNLSPFSFFNVFSSNPPILVFSPARSGRDNSQKDTHQNVLDLPEVVINIVNYDMVEQMSLSSTAYPKGVNEFIKAGFTEVASHKVAPPRVKEAPVALECTVDQVISLGDGPGAGNLIIARVVYMHVKKAFLDERGKLDTTKLDLVARMGGKWYTRVIPESLFEIPKPLKELGIGVDQLPERIRNSPILSGNNLGRLGNLKKLPSTADIEAVSQMQPVQALLPQSKDDFKVFHQLAKTWIEAGQTEAALQLLLFSESLL